MQSAAEIEKLVALTKIAWERNASFWAEKMGSHGNRFHQQFVAPAAERLLNITAGEKIVDLACGTGTFSRRLSELGVEVLACDYSENMLAIARNSSTTALNTTFLRADLTSIRDLKAIRDVGPFDAAVCNMALMDIPTLENLAAELPKLLISSGRFVATLSHPCFNATGAVTKFVTEKDAPDGSIETNRGLQLTRYATPFTVRGTGISGQPVPHHYFHRSLSDLIRPFLKAGLSLSALEEPLSAVSSTEDLSWSAFREFPPVIALRFESAVLPTP